MGNRVRSAVVYSRLGGLDQGISCIVRNCSLKSFVDGRVRVDGDVPGGEERKFTSVFGVPSRFRSRGGTARNN